MNGSGGRSDVEAEFVEFAQSRQGALVRAAYLVCGDVDVAEQVVRQTLVSLARQWGRVGDERPDAVVRRILYRDAVASRRGREAPVVPVVPVASVLAHGDDGWALDDETETDAERRRAEVMAALDTLTPAQRATVVVRHLEERGEDEAADLLGHPVRTVRADHDSALELLPWTPAEVGEQLDLASEDLPERDLVDGAWDAARRRHRTLVRRSVLGSGVALAGVAVAAIALREPDVAPGPVPTPTLSTAVADGRLPLLEIQGARVYLAPDPRSEGRLPVYPLLDELAMPVNFGPGDRARRAVMGEAGLDGVAQAVRAVFMVATDRAGSSPVLYAPGAATPHVLVPQVRVPQTFGRPGPLGPRAISDDRHRIVLHRPAGVVVLDARDGSVIEVPVPDPTLLFAGWARDGQTIVARGRDAGWVINPRSADVQRSASAVSPDWSDLADSGGAAVLRTFSGRGEITGTKDLRGPPVVPHSVSVANTEGWVGSGAFLPETYQREIERSQGFVAAQGDLPPVPRVLAATEGPLVPAQCYRALGWGPAAVVFFESRSQRPGFQGTVRRVLAWDVLRARLWRVADIEPAGVRVGDFTGSYAI
ncbi:MAG TPA: hypothetical protein VLA55_08700 [Ornithinibacter sp.]|nr:hypothetical protein [Ornithinibacter sp.]